MRLQTLSYGWLLHLPPALGISLHNKKSFFNFKVYNATNIIITSATYPRRWSDFHGKPCLPSCRPRQKRLPSIFFSTPTPASWHLVYGAPINLYLYVCIAHMWSSFIPFHLQMDTYRQSSTCNHPFSNWKSVLQLVLAFMTITAFPPSHHQNMGNWQLACIYL